MNDMREKKWVDCPACGAKKSMRKTENQDERFNPPGYPPLDISALDGQFCESCGEGFWSLKSERQIARLLAEHMARHDAERVVAAELASVKEAAEAMHVTVQGIHKMMDEGRLRYVVAGGSRLPIRRDLTVKAKARHHARA
jgi:YgiT-type zinc finger domain-containing protein